MTDREGSREVEPETNWLERAESLLSQGSGRIMAGDYAGAEADLHGALAAARKAGGGALVIDVLRELLKCAFFTQRHDTALLHGMQALQLAQQCGDTAREAGAHNDLGIIYGRLGDFEDALEHLLAGLRLLQEQGKEPNPSLLNNIGNVYSELDDHREALGFFRSALDGFRVRGTGREEGIALGNIGRASAALGEWEEAREAYQQSADFFDGRGDGAYLAPALARLATACAALGDEAAARTAFERALAGTEGSAEREFLDEVLLAAGRFHLDRGEFERALALLSRGLALLPADEATRRVYEFHHTLAEAHEQRGDPASALRHYKEYHRVRQAVSDAAITIRIRALMLHFDVERARQQEEIFRLKNVELARANTDLRDLHQQLEEQNRELQRISIEDALTGLHNRRYLDLWLPSEVSRAHRRGHPLSAAMCDIDHFKEINDRFSHAIGDEVLRQVAELFRGTVRQEDLLCRYGGEEFLLLLPETDLPGALALAERLRYTVAEHPWDRLHPELRVTLSIGLAELDGLGATEPLLSRADARLYEAKRRGRNRVCA